MLSSAFPKKEFNQMAMGIHSSDINKCDGWRSVEGIYNNKHYRICVEKNPSGYHMYNTTKESNLRFILTQEEGEELINNFHIKTTPKIPVVI